MRSRFPLLLFVLGALAGCSASSSPESPSVEDPSTAGEGVSGNLPVGSELKATGNVNLRSAPSTSGSVIEVVAAGSTVSVVSSPPQNGFYQVNHGGKVGWSSGKYYEPTGGASGSLPAGSTLIATGDVNLRSGPGTSYSVLAVVTAGTKVKLVSSSPSNGFYNIDDAGSVGFSSSKFYKLSDGSGGSSGSGGSGGSGGQTGGGVWKPTPGTSWQWQLSGSVDTSLDVSMYDVDLYDATQATIDALHAKGRVVICYFSAGTRENWRSDAGAFASKDYANALPDWPGENWLDTRSANVRNIMKKRLDLAVSSHCDGVEPDNVDAYDNDSGFPLTAGTQIDFNTFIANEAHARGLSVGLKNAVDLVPNLVNAFDWALNEQCLDNSECNKLHPFIASDKAVFHVEYATSQSQGPSKKANVCGNSTITGFSTLIKLQDLGAWRLTCG